MPAFLIIAGTKWWKTFSPGRYNWSRLWRLFFPKRNFPILRIFISGKTLENVFYELRPHTRSALVSSNKNILCIYVCILSVCVCLSATYTLLLPFEFFYDYFTCMYVRICTYTCTYMCSYVMIYNRWCIQYSNYAVGLWRPSRGFYWIQEGLIFDLEKMISSIIIFMQWVLTLLGGELLFFAGESKSVLREWRINLNIYDGYLQLSGGPFASYL